MIHVRTQFNDQLYVMKLTDDDPDEQKLVSEEQQTNANRVIFVYLEFVVLWSYNDNIMNSNCIL